MRKVLLLFSLWLPFFSPHFVSSVWADEPTPTPPNWQPLFPTSTQVPDVSYQCPEGTPEGWGVTTPSAWWYANCGECIPAIYPTSTSDPSIPTATIDPTIPTETPAPQFGNYIIGGFAEHAIGPSPYFYWASQSINYSGDQYSIYEITLNAVGAGHNNYVIVKYDGTITFSREAPGTIYVYINGGYSSYPLVLRYRSAGGWYGTWLNDSNQHYEFSLYEDGPGGDSAVIDFEAVGNHDGASINKTIHIFYSSSPIDDPFATPTPTAVPQYSYCDTVQQEGAEIDPFDYLPQVMVSDATCYGWDEYTIGDLLGAEITVPQIEVCFRAIEFGTLRIFDYEIDLDVFIYVIGAAMILRWLIRS